MSSTWWPTDHPPHQWPIGQASSWRDGYGCPTIWCKGEGSQRVEDAMPDDPPPPAVSAYRGVGAGGEGGIVSETVTMTLTEFLTARLDEDQRAAQAASNPPWIALTFYPNRSEVTNETEIDGGVIVKTPSKDDADVEHIARHDPRRVLAEVAAKRAIVKREISYGPSDGFPVVTAMLATVYADHPDYRDEWKP